jgi:hypothetical protein
MDQPDVPLKDYLVARHRQLVRMAVHMRAGLAEIDREIEAIAASAKVAGVDLNTADTTVVPRTETQERRDKTMKEAAVEILQEATGGLTARELLDVMHARYGFTYPRSSLSPQLSRLLGDGVLARHNGRWMLKSNQPKEADIFG